MAIRHRLTTKRPDKNIPGLYRKHYLKGRCRVFIFIYLSLFFFFRNFSITVTMRVLHFCPPEGTSKASAYFIIPTHTVSLGASVLIIIIIIVVVLFSPENCNIIALHLYIRPKENTDFYRQRKLKIFIVVFKF